MKSNVPGMSRSSIAIIMAALQAMRTAWLPYRHAKVCMERYRRMASYVPALLIRLNIDAETAYARKPDHKLSMLRDKVRVIPTLHFNHAHILDLDGTSPYPGVLQAALIEARAALA